MFTHIEDTYFLVLPGWAFLVAGTFALIGAVQFIVFVFAATATTDGEPLDFGQYHTEEPRGDRLPSRVRKP